MNLVKRLHRFHQGRGEPGLRKKYAAMRESAPRFLRATNFLFFEGLPPASDLHRTPLTWICGDLHVENFGTYKGDNRLAYFDINDFDDALLAPASWDLVRFLASLEIAAMTLKLGPRPVKTLCKTYLSAYRDALRDGKPRWLERDLAQGAIKDLFDKVRQRTRVELLKERTRLKKNKRALIIDDKRTTAIGTEAREKILDFMQKFAQQQSQAQFFKVLSIAGRLSGTASLGLERYIVLVEGRGSPDGNFLLDIKEAQESSLAHLAPDTKASWKTPAERVVSVQQWAQAISPAFLHAVRIARKSYVLKDLQASADRLDLADLQNKPDQLDSVVHNMGELTAWAHLRGAGHRGAALPDEWIEIAHRQGWRKAVLQAARERSEIMQAYYKLYCEAYNDGEFGSVPPKAKGRRRSSMRKTA